MSDYPLELAGAHGRIAAYRGELRDANEALLCAAPYVYNVAADASSAPWRKETARETMEKIRAARDCIEAELAVTNP